MIKYHEGNSDYFDAIKGYDARFPEKALPVKSNVTIVKNLIEPGSDYVRITKPNDGDTDPCIEMVGNYFPLGDCYVSNDVVLFIPNATAKNLHFFYTEDYEGGNDCVRYIFPTALLVDPVSKATGAPAKDFCLCPGGYLTLDNDEMLYGFDAEHYIYKKDELIGVAGVKNASVPFFPFPESIKSAAFVRSVLDGKFTQNPEIGLLGNYTSPVDGMLFFDNDAKAAVQSFRNCVRNGLPFSNLHLFKSRKLVTKNGISKLEASVLFGSNVYSEKAVETVYVGASAELRIADAVKRGIVNFTDGDLFDINDEISRIISEADLEGKKAYAAYYDSIVTSVVEYCERVKNFAEECAASVVTERMGKTVTIGDASVEITQPLIDITTKEIPAKSGDSESYVNQIITMFGRGMIADQMKWNDELEKSVKAQVSDRISDIYSVIDEAASLVNTAMGSFKVTDTSSYTKGYWAFGDHSVSRPSVCGSEMVRKVKKMVLSRNGNVMTCNMQFAFAPFEGVNYKVGEDTLVARTKTAMAAAFTALGLNVKFIGLGSYVKDRGKAAWWWHDKATDYKCFMGVCEFRDRYLNIDNYMDVCREQLWEFSFDITLPSTSLELDLTTTDNSAVAYFQGKATEAYWLAYANHVVTHLENAVDCLKDRKPFVRIDGIIYTLAAAAAFGIPLINEESLTSAITTMTAMKTPQNLATLNPAIELLEFIRSTIISQAAGITPLCYITSSDIENSILIDDPDSMFVHCFSIVSEE